MKKLIAVLLALTLCLSLAACAQKEDEAVTANREALAAADALLEAGDYEAAMNAYYAVPVFIEITNKIDDAYVSLVRSLIGPYVGTWMDLNSGTVVEVTADGMVRIMDEYGNDYTNLAGYFEGELYVYGEAEIVEIDGVRHMKDEYNDFVLAEDYDALCAKAVEITLENWETYFELREAKSAYRDNEGKINHYNIGYGIFLREEYAAKLKNEWDSVNVTFKMSYDEAHYHVEGDYPEGDWTLGEQYTEPYYEYKTQEFEQAVWSYNYEDESAVSDFLGHHAAEFTMGYVSTWDGKITAMKPINPQIIEVSGTITMFP